MAKANGKSKKPMTKSEIMATLATETNLTKKDVARILEGLGKLIEKNIGKRGPGVFNVPGLLKVMVVRKPATEPAKGSIPSRVRRRCSRPNRPATWSRFGQKSC